MIDLQLTQDELATMINCVRSSAYQLKDSDFVLVSSAQRLKSISSKLRPHANERQKNQLDHAMEGL